MENFILTINIISAILLVAVILLQKSEGGALGLGVSQDSFVSSRSASNFLSKATGIIATIFIITSISVTILSQEKIPKSSVLEKTEEKQKEKLQGMSGKCLGVLDRLLKADSDNVKHNACKLILECNGFTKDTNLNVKFNDKDYQRTDEELINEVADIYKELGLKEKLIKNLN